MKKGAIGPESCQDTVDGCGLRSAGRSDSLRAMDEEDEIPHDLTIMSDRTNKMIYGRRLEFASAVDKKVSEAGDLVRSILADGETPAEVARVIVRGAKRGDRSCLNHYTRLMKLAGEERKLTIEFLHSYGVRTEDELRRMVDTVRSAEDSNVVDGIERATAYLEAALRLEPHQRDLVVRRLGGLVPVPSQERS